MDRDIIDRVFNRVATPEEAQMVAEWLKTDEGQAYLSVRLEREASVVDDELLQEWSYCEVPEERLRRKSLGTIKSKIQEGVYQVVLAALIPIILLGSTLLFMLFRMGSFSDETIEVKVPYGEVAQVLLQDGTSIKLNSESTLSYPKKFSLFRRKVALNGEGYFEVQSDQRRPFMIELNGVVIRVTGTSFNLKAYGDEDIVVSLDEGHVELIDDDNHVYPLEEGEEAVYNRKSQQCVIRSSVEQLSANDWPKYTLRYYRAPLGEILDQLSKRYHVEFVAVSDTILDVKFSIVSESEDLYQILRELESISNIMFEPISANQFCVRDVKK